MRANRIIVLIVVCALCAMNICAQQWKSLFAYNNVVQIAIAPERVYALSDGSLYSVEKQTEEIRTYNSQSGLHSTGITCIHFDEAGNQLLIAYATGKMDVITSTGVRYVGELYEKDMTQRKNIYNMTIYGRTAYLSTHYGVQTFDLREKKFVDSYWLRPNGEETPIQDVLIANDSIYAFLYGAKDKGKKDSLYCASIHDNLVDYTVWKREARNGRISPDSEKGTHYIDGSDHWYAAQAEGIVRFMASGRRAYKPEGPLVNVAYNITTVGKELWIVQGGRWAVQYNRPGVVMHYNGSRWKNIDAASIKAKTGNPALDFMNVAVDPRDKNHYYVTSYGTGLYEFYNDSVVKQYLPGDDNTLVAVLPDKPTRYTRLSYATYDDDNNLWLLDAETSPQLHCIDSEGQWHAVNIYHDGMLLFTPTPGGLIMDSRNSNHKWIISARDKASVCLLDDNGTRFDESDDKVIYRNEWINQHGMSFKPTKIYHVLQDVNNNIWIASDAGLAYISAESDYTKSNMVIQPDVMDNNGENPLTTQETTALCEDVHGNIWVGTQTLGVYVLAASLDSLITQYTTDNSAMPGNSILSLARDAEGVMYVGTADGLACYDENKLPTDEDPKGDEEDEPDPGKMLRWSLHYSYNSPSEIAYSSKRVFAVSSGALYSVDKESEELEYWNKSTGLTGSVIRHIAYDENTKQMVIGYEDGRIDLLADNGTVRPMPDLSLKATSISPVINSISVGAENVYLAMPFGVIALNSRKAEIKATYYIGDYASAVNVLQVLEKGDSLYAFTADAVYSASMKDDLSNYVYWHISYLEGGLTQAVLHNGTFYILQHDTLYYWQNGTWKQVLNEPLLWIHVSNGQLLAGRSTAGLWRIDENHQLVALQESYGTNDGVFTNGDYWMGIEGFGLVKLTAQGLQFYEADGPMSNSGYFLTAAQDHVYVVPGGRWASAYGNPMQVSIYNSQTWSGMSVWDIQKQTNVVGFDPVSVAVDPRDKSHYFVATYASGIFEFKSDNTIQHYNHLNSTIQPANSTVAAEYFTRTDGALMDEEGNLWVLNATTIGQPLHVRANNGQWKGISLYDHGALITLETPGRMLADKRNANRKWFIDQRATPAVYLYDDGGTPTITGDDKYIRRNSFTDQSGASIAPEMINSIEQDNSNRIWIGTPTGLFIIPASVDFFTSNACQRIIIPRNDGTGLGDYLLGNEQINCMAADGGNRMWIGTANSGLYLIEDDTITVAHFTTKNSLLPSNTIQSIAIMPTTGEVFVGTDKGIASYRSDASEPKDDFSAAYAYPNPVRPDYSGIICIAGLMENTVVNIIDAGGNLVCKTRSHGGLAIWDGKLPDGRRATPGVYTALCNAEKRHTVVKILVVH